MSELLPCPSPWCAESKPELQQGGFRNGHFRVECQTCFTKGPTKDDLNGGGPAAIAAWNTRSNSLPELVAALEAWVTYDTRDDDGPNAGVQMMVDYDHALTLTHKALSALKVGRG